VEIIPHALRHAQERQEKRAAPLPAEAARRVIMPERLPVRESTVRKKRTISERFPLLFYGYVYILFLEIGKHSAALRG